MTLHANSRPTKRVTQFRGLPINVEIEAGEEKCGTDAEGRDWAHVYQVPYGEIPGTEGDDGDPVDVYVGPDAAAPFVFVVHQLDLDGAPDEDKVFLGFGEYDAARTCYYAHGPAWGFGSMDVMTFEEFARGYLAATRAPAGLYEGPAEREHAGRSRYGR